MLITLFLILLGSRLPQSAAVARRRKRLDGRKWSQRETRGADGLSGEAGCPKFIIHRVQANRHNNGKQERLPPYENKTLALFPMHK